MQGRELREVTIFAITIIVISIVISLLLVLVGIFDGFKENEMDRIEEQEHLKITRDLLNYERETLYGSELLSMVNRLLYNDKSIVIKNDNSPTYERYMGAPISKITRQGEFYVANIRASVPTGVSYLGSDIGILRDTTSSYKIDTQARYESQLIRETNDTGNIIGVVFIFKP